MLTFKEFLHSPHICHSKHNQESNDKDFAALEMTVIQSLRRKIRRHIHAHQQHRRIVEVGMEITMNAAIAPAMA